MVPTEVKGVLEHKKMVAVACGGYHTAALMKDGKGNARHGQSWFQTIQAAWRRDVADSSKKKLVVEASVLASNL